MTTEDVKRLGIILAIQAKIEGMKAENERMRINGYPPVYDGISFDTMANMLEKIVYKHDDEL